MDELQNKESYYSLPIAHKMWLNPDGGESEYYSHTIDHKVVMRIVENAIYFLLTMMNL